MAVPLVHHKNPSLHIGLQGHPTPNPPTSSYFFASSSFSSSFPQLQPHWPPWCSWSPQQCSGLRVFVLADPSSSQPPVTWQVPSTHKWQFPWPLHSKLQLLFPHHPHPLPCFIFLYSPYHLPMHCAISLFSCVANVFILNCKAWSFAALISHSVIITLQQCLALKGQFFMIPIHRWGDLAENTEIIFPGHMITTQWSLKFKHRLVWPQDPHSFLHIVASFLSKLLIKYFPSIRGWLPFREWPLSRLWILGQGVRLWERPRKERNDINTNVGVLHAHRSEMPSTSWDRWKHPSPPPVWITGTQAVGKLVTHTCQPRVPHRLHS